MNPQMPAALRSYMISAMIDYCVAHGLSPYIVVFVTPECEVPLEYVEDNRIVLDIEPEAVNKFDLNEKELTFQANFGETNTICDLRIPMDNVEAVFPSNDVELAIHFDMSALARRLQEAASGAAKSEAASEDAPVRRPMRVK